MAIEMKLLAENITTLIDGIVKLFGHKCEIALFSIEDSKQKLIYSVNSQVTGRQQIDNMNQYELEALNKTMTHNEHTIFSYISKEGRNIKSALFNIKDLEKKEIYAMIVSFDITNLMLAKNVLELICNIDETIQDHENITNGIDTKNINSLMQELIAEVLENFGKPVSYLTKEDKVNIVRTLNNKDIFLIKGAVEYVAEKLCVSRFTIYNYLEEIRLRNS